MRKIRSNFYLVTISALGGTPLTPWNLDPSL